MAWIESHQELRNHPKVRRLARGLNVAVPAAIGHLHLLWWWAIDYAPDGCLAGYEDWEIAEAALWEGDPAEFTAVLMRVGWVDQDDTLHDWDDYAGKLIRSREQARVRMAAKRAATVPERSANVPGTEQEGSSLQYRTGQDTTVPDSPAPAERKKRATRIPPDFRITPAMREWAAGQGYPEEWVDRTTARFVDWWTGEGRTKTDWPATWRNWLRSEAERRPPAPAPVGQDHQEKEWL